jgi:hypothetical protein
MNTESPKPYRSSEVFPGYDCILHPCGKNGCGTHPMSSHGRHGDEWTYVVTDGKFAVSLTVFTNRLNGNLHPPLRTFSPRGTEVLFHTHTSNLEEERGGIRSGSKCAYLAGGHCLHEMGPVGAARAFFAEHGRGEYEQSEPFWLALEAKWEEMRQVEEAEEAEEKDRSRVKRCPDCTGRGVVAAAEPAANPEPAPQAAAVAQDFQTSTEGPIDDTTLLNLWLNAQSRLHVSCDEMHTHWATAGCLSGDQRDIDLCRLAEALTKERKAVRSAVATFGSR